MLGAGEGFYVRGEDYVDEQDGPLVPKSASLA